MPPKSSKLFELKFTLPPGYKRISNLPEHIQSNVLQALSAGLLIAKGTAQSRYMTGPRPDKLGVVTGLLRSRVKHGVKRGGPGVFAIGSLGVDGVKYWAIHEFGGDIHHPGSKARKGKFMRFRYENEEGGLGPWIFARTTKPHIIPMPARPYLRPALMDSIPIISDLIQSAIDEAWGDSTK